MSCSKNCHWSSRAAGAAQKDFNSVLRYFGPTTPRIVLSPFVVDLCTARPFFSLLRPGQVMSFSNSITTLLAVFRYSEGFGNGLCGFRKVEHRHMYCDMMANDTTSHSVLNASITHSRVVSYASPDTQRHPEFIISTCRHTNSCSNYATTSDSGR